MLYDKLTLVSPVSLRGVLSPHYWQEEEADIEATQETTELPIWLRTLSQPPQHTHTHHPHGSAWHAGEEGPTLFSATGAERAYRQMDDLDRLLPCSSHKLSHTISYCNYHCNHGERRKQRHFFMMFICCNHFKSPTFVRQKNVTWEAQDVILYQSCTFQFIYSPT